MNESVAAETLRDQSGAVKPATPASAEVLRNFLRENGVFMANGCAVIIHRCAGEAKYFGREN
jgi:hypothetical protein